jgi:hypothetical protein
MNGERKQQIGKCRKKNSEEMINRRVRWRAY